MKKSNEKTPLLQGEQKKDKLNLCQELLKILRSKDCKGGDGLIGSELFAEYDRYNKVKDFFEENKNQDVKLDLNSITLNHYQVKKTFLQYVIDKNFPDFIVRVLLENGLKVTDKEYAHDLCKTAIECVDNSFLQLIIGSCSQGLLKLDDVNTTGVINNDEDSSL